MDQLCQNCSIYRWFLLLACLPCSDAGLVKEAIVTSAPITPECSVCGTLYLQGSRYQCYVYSSRILKKHEGAIRFKRIKRMMEPHGPPERRLTWNAMEQIRYLKQEFPEEWTVQRLAEGFNVSTDVIKRVLKAKFVPSAARKMKQDAAASKHLGQISLSTTPDQLKLMPASIDPTQQLLGHGKSERQLIVSQSPPLLQSPTTSDVSHVAVRTEGTQMQRHITNTLVPQNVLQKLQGAPPPPQSNATTDVQEDPVPGVPVENDWKYLDEKWDGEVLSDQELEELAESGVENRMNVVQKGKEFFDSDGNFLYSI